MKQKKEVEIIDGKYKGFRGTILAQTAKTADVRIRVFGIDVTEQIALSELRDQESSEAAGCKLMASPGGRTKVQKDADFLTSSKSASFPRTGSLRRVLYVKRRRQVAR